MNEFERHLYELEKKYKKNATAPSDLKGEASERLFEQMTNTLVNRGAFPWVYKVRRSNPMENFIGKSDFKILAISENGRGNSRVWIRIQIKSSAAGARIFAESYPHLKRRVHVVVMDEKITTETMRKTLNLIYLKEMRKKYHPVPSIA